MNRPAPPTTQEDRPKDLQTTLMVVEFQRWRREQRGKRLQIPTLDAWCLTEPKNSGGCAAGLRCR